MHLCTLRFLGKPLPPPCSGANQLRDPWIGIPPPLASNRRVGRRLAFDRIGRPMVICSLESTIHRKMYDSVISESPEVKTNPMG